MHAADFSHEHAVAHARLSSAVAGFGSTLSATALNERIALWEQETADHHADLMHHGEGHRAAGAQYSAVDEDSSAQITTAGSDFDGASRALRA
jgi:uncharacterized small protein (DUF1192 family)